MEQKDKKFGGKKKGVYGSEC